MCLGRREKREEVKKVRTWMAWQLLATLLLVEESRERVVLHLLLNLKLTAQTNS